MQLLLAGLASALLLWAAAVATMLWVYRRDLQRLWREPIMRRPVLVIESDDWGAGPLAQAAALQGLDQVLACHHDCTGRVPVLNLALVLAVPDGPAIAAGGHYRRVALDAPCFAPIVEALRAGAARGTFALQLHGMEHFWPPTLMASPDPAVQAWLRQPVPEATERLPSPLQSRWVDARTLPSAPHGAQAIRDAAREEVQAFERTFGVAPRAVVPPTFVWTRTVESAWASAGIEFVVTPGWRYTQRNANGLPAGDEGPIANGDREGALTYLARRDYFEPARGRDAAYALRALANAVTEGRPCLLENHRDNYIFDDEQAKRSLVELDALCAGALQRFPQLRFVSTVELGRIVRVGDPQWIAGSWCERLPFAWQRLRGSGRLWRLLLVSGAAAAAGPLVSFIVARRSTSNASGRPA